MAIIDMKPKIKLALSGARSIRASVTQLQSLPATFKYNLLENPIYTMQQRAILDIKPLTDNYTLEEIQLYAEPPTFHNVPANLRTLLLNIGVTVTAFMSAFGAIFAGAGNVRTFNSSTGEFDWITVNLSDLSSLSDEVAAIGSACDLVAMDD